MSGGAVGFGTFIWPANNHHLSGFDYRPDANHWGIDIAGNDGEGVYARRMPVSWSMPAGTTMVMAI